MKFFKKNINMQQTDTTQSRRFTLGQYITAVGILLVGVTAIASAVSVVGFTPGTTISADAVNKRFEQLEAASTSTMGRNLIVNATFQVNNGNAGIPYVSGGVLNAGEYGHEMWKAGTGGAGQYIFTQNPASTTITISPSRTLVQVIEDANVGGTTYTLSWKGTAQARVTVNSANQSGTYAASPITVTGQVPGTTMSIEFNAGTLSEPQLEAGTLATKFERQSIGQVLAVTQRYYQKLGMLYGFAYTNTQIIVKATLLVPLRVAPTVALISSTPYAESPPYSVGFTGSAATVYNGHPSVWTTDVMISGFTGLIPNTVASFNFGQLLLSARL